MTRQWHSPPNDWTQGSASLAHPIERFSTAPHSNPSRTPINPSASSLSVVLIRHNLHYSCTSLALATSYLVQPHLAANHDRRLTLLPGENKYSTVH